MKKIYLKPSFNVVKIKSTSLICASDDIVSDRGMKYGGVDEGGVKDPDARESLFDRSGGSSAWDEW